MAKGFVAVNTVLQEVAAEALSPNHIEKRVDDWQARIGELYSKVERWLPSAMVPRYSRKHHMDEELMREFGVPAVELPILDVLAGEEVAATLEPRGLWVIGANGRLDLVRGDSHFIIVDTAKNFEKPRWMIAPLTDRTNLRALTKDVLHSVLKREGSR